MSVCDVIAQTNTINANVLRLDDDQWLASLLETTSIQAYFS